MAEPDLMSDMLLLNNISWQTNICLSSGYTAIKVVWLHYLWEPEQKAGVGSCTANIVTNITVLMP